MRTLLLLALLAIAADTKSILQKRAIAEFPNADALPSLIDFSSDAQINSYKSMLEDLLRQLSAIEQNYESSDNPSSTEVIDEYQREFYTQAASDIVQKLIQYGSLSAILDAENAEYYEDKDGDEKEPSDAVDVEQPMVRVGVRVEETVPSTGEEETLMDEQAHEILKMLVEEMMDKFFADAKNTKVFVLGASSKQEDDEEPEPTSESEAAEEEEEDDSSSSSSEEDSDEYYYNDIDDIELETDEDDAVIVVNKQVSTNLIRIPAATFVDALNKLLPTFKSPYPQHLPQLTPLQIEDPRVYGDNGDASLTGSGPATIYPRVSAHSVRPIMPTAAAAAEHTTESHICRHAFDLGHILLCIAAVLLALWAIAQLVSMYRKRDQPATSTKAAPLPAKAIPSIIPNIYATPPPVLSKMSDPEKPPVYVENPSVHKSEA